MHIVILTTNIIISYNSYASFLQQLL